MLQLFKQIANPKNMPKNQIKSFRGYSQPRYAFCQENNKHKEAFGKLKDKISSENSDSKIKMQFYQDMMKNAKDTVTDKLNKIDLSKVNVENLKSKFSKQEQEQEQQQKQEQNNEKDNKQEMKQQQEEENKDEVKEQQKEEEVVEDKKTYFQELQEQDSYLGKTLKFGVGAWKQTFPNEKDVAMEKLKKAKEAAKKLREEEENRIEYSEEEIEQMQESIPDWKKTSLQTVEGQKIAKESMASKLKGRVKSKFNQTEFAQNLYKSEEYKEYEDFKSEMAQFKEDAKDHLHNHPSQVVQGALYVKERASTENSVVRSIREMRKYDPEFDLWELEKESRFIFETAYQDFLEGNLEALEKYCGEQALGYFKVLIKKREAEKATPRYKKLWTCDRGMFSKAYFPDSLLPVFVFTIKAQEIYCNVCNITGKVIDGSDDNIMGYDFIFAIRMHQDPQIEEVGHKWEVVEVQPQQVVKMLV